MARSRKRTVRKTKGPEKDPTNFEPRGPPLAAASSMRTQTFKLESLILAQNERWRRA